LGKIARVPEICKDNCKTCTSPYRLDIEAKRLVDGMSYDNLELYVKEKYEHLDFTVSKLALRNHFMKHVNKTSELKARYYAEQEKIKEGLMPNPYDDVEVKLFDLRHLDRSIAELSVMQKASALEIQEELSRKIPKSHVLKDDEGNIIGYKNIEKVDLTPSLVNLFKVCTEELRQNMKAKAEIIGMDENFKNEDKKASIVDFMYEMVKERNTNADGEEIEVVFDA